jgi:hypothetical protein
MSDSSIGFFLTGGLTLYIKESYAVEAEACCGKSISPAVSKSGLVFAAREQLHPIAFFLQEPDRLDAILFQATIKFAAINSQRRGRSYLISFKLMKNREDVVLLNVRQLGAAFSISFQDLPEVD